MRRGARKQITGCYLADDEKAKIQAIADAAFEGNISDALRWLIHSASLATIKKDVLSWRRVEVRAQLEAELAYLTSMDT